MALHYEVYGDRDAAMIVFLHGGGVSSWMWAEQVRFFSEFCCVTVDLPHHGKSESVGAFSIESAAREVIRLIEELNHGGEIIVVGFSLGAQVLIQMLGMKPGLIDRAMINSALVKPMSLGRHLIGPLVKMTFPLIRNRTFSKMQAKALHIREAHFEQYYEESLRIRRQTLIDVLQENMAFALPGETCHTGTEILVTVGEKENGMMRASAMDLVHHFPRATGVVIGGLGHGAMMAEPDLFNCIVRDWILMKDDCEARQDGYGKL